jgi:hypothetical protein
MADGNAPRAQQPEYPRVASASRSGGSSRRLPIVVAAGLAVGVFAGLLLVRARGGGPELPDPAAADERAATAVRPATADAGARPAAEPAVADAAPVRPDAGAPDAAPRHHHHHHHEDDVAEAGSEESSSHRTAVLRFAIRPPGVEGVRITVDGAAVDGASRPVDLSDGPERVKVVVRARGYLTWSRRITVRHDQTVRVELERPGPVSGGPGGLIDL